jgi:hypothetical protein
MSNTKREPLLSDKDINDPKLVIPLGAKMIRDIYENARAKDAELIQQLVDALLRCERTYTHGQGGAYEAAVIGLNEAAAAGFKPSDQ